MLGIMASPKVRMINVRLTPDVHDAFKIAAELRGASMSSLLHQFVVRTIREEKEMDPAAFGLTPQHGIKAMEITLSKPKRKAKTGS